MVDIKYMYQKKADEIAYEKYDVDFYDLSDQQQVEVYNLAVEAIGEELQESADNLREEMILNGEI